jgi:low affinity Fe/Cu permease
MGTPSFFVFFPTPFFYIVCPFLPSIGEFGNMDWIFYGLSIGIVTFLGKSWIDYMDRMDRLLNDTRKLRQKIQQHVLKIEEKSKKLGIKRECVMNLEDEKDDLARELHSVEALLVEMMRKEQRHDPEGFLVELEALEV